MDPHSSPYKIPNNSPHNPLFPTKNQTEEVTWYSCYVAEFLGTFVLVFTAACWHMVAGKTIHRLRSLVLM